MEQKCVADSQVTLAVVMGPQDANPAGNVHGGVIMKLIDTAAGTVAARHARSNVVTASIDRLDFLGPVFIGDLVTLRACINYTGRTSMEVGVRVEAETIPTNYVRHTASAYLTFVSLDREGRPTETPPITPKTDVETRRNQEAAARRKMRVQEKKSEKERATAPSR
ncbi:MAG: acyl-CoA thioesterase [Syntrophobacteraceae bacterium]